MDMKFKGVPVTVEDQKLIDEMIEADIEENIMRKKASRNIYSKP